MARISSFLSTRLRTSTTARLTLTVLLFFVALPADATRISHSGTFEDPTSPEGDGDEFTLTNDLISEVDIISVVIDLSFAAASPDVSFDPSDFPFTADGPSAALTGFVTAVFTGSTLLTLTFADFNPNETFSFAVDVDDDNNRVESISIASSQIIATFDIDGGTDLTAVMVPTAAFETTWTNTAVVPEPATLSLVALGLTGFAWKGRRASRATALARPHCSRALPRR